MKVLFAVNNESISESIIKRYQQDYKEIISAKNVYYFNAIIKELQKDKSYDRIVISEDLEPFSNNNYDAIDKFIFEKMDSISDEATNGSGNDIPIILICADRRSKAEPLLVKLFGIGVYNALIGKDRSITTVCELLNRPRGKKEAKAYYRIDSDDVDYKVENEGDVSEVEIQNILNHYKKLGRNEEKYVESFDHIASQYTANQLRLIAKFLPLNVKAVLEANSSTYQEIISFGGNIQPNQEENYKKDLKQSKANKQQKDNQNKKGDVELDLIEKNLNKSKITEPVVIPSGINTTKVRKVAENSQSPINSDSVEQQHDTAISGVEDILEDISIPETTVQPVEPIVEGFEDIEEKMQEVLTAQPKRRGRPKKIQPESNMPSTLLTGEEPKKRGRGRPKKIQPEVIQESEIEQNSIQQNVVEKQTNPVNLFELGEEIEDTNTNVNTTYSDMILPGLDDEEFYMNESQENTSTVLPEETEAQNTSFENSYSEKYNNKNFVQAKVENEMPNQIPNFETATTQTVQNTGKYNLSNTDLSSLLSKDKKVVAFVGTSKNGTSFLVNNLAEMFSQRGISTALLDLTQNRNAYYIYTENEEELRQTAFRSIANLKRGEPEGIQVNKNLTVYTTLPGDNEDINDYANILETLLKNYSLVLLDCDFETNYGYFKEAQEIYLVQSLDVLTIQPLTAFLRDLKAKNVLNPEKIRIALNKVVKVRSVTDKTIIGGMAYYNDPAMSFMTELFNKDIVPYCSIPFEEQAYSKYLEGLINCKISINGYSKNFMAALSKLANMVYPLIGNGKTPIQKEYNNYNNNSTNNGFSNSMNDTLNKMKNNY